MPAIKRATPNKPTETVEERRAAPAKPATKSVSAADLARQRKAPPVLPGTTGPLNSENKFLLATEFSEPVSSLGGLIWLLYGEKKIGKSSLAAMFPNAWFALFEPGGKGLRIKQNPVPTWLAWEAYQAQLLKSDYQTIIIDTVDISYDRCLAQVCKEEGWDHPSDASFGKGWNAVESRFVSSFNKLAQSGKGVIFISHAEDKQFERRSGGAYNKVVPSMAKAPWGYTEGISDIIAQYGYYGDERYLRIIGNEDVEAGHRMKYNFWVYDENRTEEQLRQVLESVDETELDVSSLGWERVQMIPMGKSEQEAYRNIQKAFRNEQTDNGEPNEEAELSHIPKKMSKSSK